MKTKAKLVLALSVLTAGTAVAGATGTFAWFTTNRSATLIYNNISAVNNHGTLKVELKKLSDGKAGNAVADEKDASKKPSLAPLTLQLRIFPLPMARPSSSRFGPKTLEMETLLKKLSMPPIKLTTPCI